MPELPEVESIKRMLNERIIGKPITEVEISLPKIVRHGDLHRMIGGSFIQVERRGKYLVFRTDSDLTMYSHLRMSGTFIWKDDIDEIPGHIRASISFGDEKLLYRDIRTFGGLWLYENNQVPWKSLGVDPFDEKFTPSFLKKLLHKHKRPIKAVLLDQAIIAGIGNIYASEILFAAGVHPNCRANELNMKEIVKICEKTISILKASIDSGGTTFRDFKLSDGRDGEFKGFLKVYGKAGESCSVCNSSIQRIVQSQRSTFLCPECQPE